MPELRRTSHTEVREERSILSFLRAQRMAVRRLRRAVRVAHREHGVEDHIGAVSKFLRPYLDMSAGETKPTKEFKVDKPSADVGTSLKAHGVRAK